MKKIALLFPLAFAAILSVNAQTVLTLTGASPYNQDFNSLGSGLPTGWNCYNTATSSSLGTLDGTFGPTTSWGAYFDTTDCPSDVFGTGFKNSASANGGSSLLAASTCATQEMQTDRCLAVRQSSATSHPGYDPGAAFCLHLDGTFGMTGLACSFKLQSLDELSPRTTTFMVDYGFGASPTAFTAATAVGTMTTGGSSFTNNNVTVNFGSALDNKTTDVWIRISTQAASTGSGNRATSGIDDFNLTWSGTAYPTSVRNITATPGLSLMVIGDATSNNVSMQYVAEDAGNYSLNVYDLSGRVISSSTVEAVNGAGQISLNNLNLVPGMYIARMQNGNSSAVARVAVH